VRRLDLLGPGRHPLQDAPSRTGVPPYVCLRTTAWMTFATSSQRSTALSSFS
jgi:hypothetical protein